MNLYCVVEGEKTEKLVYRAWLEYLFPDLEEVHRPEDLRGSSLRLIVGYGYPNYLDIIEQTFAEIRDVVRNRVDHVFVCVDAEEIDASERLAEVEEKINQMGPVVRWTVIVQNCCLETWLLGNRRFVKANPQKDPRAIEYRGLYDVRLDDPEHMPNLKNERFVTRAQFHQDYLRAVFRERNEHYSKKRPGRACDSQYLATLAERSRETGHLASFGRLVTVCRDLGTAFPAFAAVGESGAREPGRQIEQVPPPTDKEPNDP